MRGTGDGTACGDAGVSAGYASERGVSCLLQPAIAGTFVAGLLLVCAVAGAQPLPGGSDGGQEPVLVPTAQTAPASATEDGEEELSPEHGKLNTADASTVDPGHVELETGFSYARARDRWAAGGRSRSRQFCRESATGLGATVGIVEDFDVSACMDYLWLYDRENGNPNDGDDIGDLSVSGRYRFYNDEERHLEMAFITGITMPTGTASCRRWLGTSQEFYSWENALALSKDWGRWTVNADAGYSLPFGKEREDARGVFNADAALGYQLTRWLQPEVELNYAQEFLHGAGEAQDLSATAGLVMPINDRWAVKAGVQQSLWGRNSDKATTCVFCLKLAF